MPPDADAVEVVSNRVLTIPNLISFARLCLVPVFLWLYVVRHVLAAMILLGIIGTSDFVDGKLARATGQVSVLGKLLDPLSDRVVIIAVLLAYGLRGTIPWWLVTGIIARDVILLPAFVVLERKGLPRIAVNRTGKWGTATLFSGMGIVSLSAVMKVSGVSWLRTGAGGMRTAGLVALVVGGVLYWTAAILYAGEVRRLLNQPKT